MEWKASKPPRQTIILGLPTLAQHVLPLLYLQALPLSRTYGSLRRPLSTARMARALDVARILHAGQELPDAWAALPIYQAKIAIRGRCVEPQ